MLEIKILCAPEDLAAHLDALCGIDPDNSIYKNVAMKPTGSWQ